MTRIAVFGASGFVGASLVERLLAGGDWEVLPLIHSSGNAGRLARYGLPLRSVDLLCAHEVRGALKDCTHVVNCTRGSKEVMINGLRNLLRASRSAGVQRLVHLSSTAAYGEPLLSGSVHEDVQPRPFPGTYGWIKMQQDQMVLKACQRGLPSVIICPPNVSGPYSPFLLSVIAAIRESKLALVDGGESPCNLVDVQNLAKAIELALFCEKAQGTRIFVTDDEQTTWRQVVEALAPLPNRSLPLSSIRGEELRKTMSEKKPQPSLLSSMKHSLSSDVRNVLCQDPLFAKVDGFMRASIGMLPKKVEDRLRTWLAGIVLISKVETDPVYENRFCIMQLGRARYSCDRARKILGYSPEFSFSESTKAFRSWYETTHGWTTDSWTLLQQL